MTSHDTSSGGLRRRDKAILFAGLASLSMGQAVILPILGPAVREIGVPESQIGLIVSAGALVAVVAAPWWGRRSDRTDRRHVFALAILAGLVSILLTGAILFMGQSGILAAGSAFVLLLVTRIAYAAVAAGGFTAASGFIADRTPTDLRAGAMALTGAGFGTGSVVGAALVYVLAGALGPTPPFLLAAGFGIFAFCFTRGGLRGDDTRTQRTGPVNMQGRHAGKSWPILLIACLAFTAASMIQQIVPFLVQDAGGLSLDATMARSGV